MNDDFKVLIAGVFIFLFVFVAGNFLNLWSLQYFGVKKENARREIFEETKSHVHGTIQNLSRMRLEYKTSNNEAHKAALREMILTEASAFDKSKLPDDLYRFIKSLGGY